MEKLNQLLEKYGIQFICTNCDFKKIKNIRSKKKETVQSPQTQTKKKKIQKITYRRYSQSIFRDTDFPEYQQEKFNLEEDTHNLNFKEEIKILRTPIQGKRNCFQKTTASKLNNIFNNLDQEQDHENVSQGCFEDRFKISKNFEIDIFGISKSVSPISIKINSKNIFENEETSKNFNDDLSFF